MYEKAVNGAESDVDDHVVRTLCGRFAMLEKGLGEIDRARAILTHGAQMSDPKRCAAYWKQWEDFEVPTLS